MEFMSIVLAFELEVRREAFAFELLLFRLGFNRFERRGCSQPLQK
jgi:hypothetical protein